jgi:cytoskeleton protein RodZ
VPGTAVSLRLNFSADSWVELYDAGGQRVFFDMGSAATVRDVKAAAPLKVFLGYADGVQLELNGQPLVLPAEVRRGNVARFTVDASGQVKRSKG